MRWTLALAVLALALPARADVPPSPYSPDSACTLEAQCAHGTFCPYAWKRGEAPPMNPEGEACRKTARAGGLQRRCRDGSNYAGKELFCPKGETGTWKPPAPPTAAPSATGAPIPTAEPSATASPTAGDTDTTPPRPASRCAMSPGGGGHDITALGTLAAALVVAARRRSPRRR